MRVNGKPSGLGPLSKDQYLSLLELYKRNTAQSKHTQQVVKSLRKLSVRGRGGPRFESKAHKLLKDRVAASPDKILKEAGLRTVAVERALDTGDKPDIVLEDALGRPVGVEIEVDVRAADIVGALQAAKYRALLAFLSDRPDFEARGFLVAHSISRDVRERCERYGIKAIEVPSKGRGK
jgi:RecB family endonuclease NucS